MSGATYDTGMLIALERRKQRAMNIHEVLTSEGIRVTVPWAVVAEFWRERSEYREKILRSVDIESPSLTLAKNVGEALAAIARATLVDATVMASAALRGDVVYTSDFDDLSRLKARFPTVRILVV